MIVLPRLALVLTMGFATPIWADGPMSSVEIGAITHLMMNQFDRPEAPLTVEPVTILGDSAIAGWRQGDMAGRALLRRSADGWAIVLCAGEEVLDPAFLAHNGIGMEAAHGLTDAARSAESGLGAELIARLDAFDGVVMIASGDAHDHGQHGDGHSSAAGH